VGPGLLLECQTVLESGAAAAVNRHPQAVPRLVLGDQQLLDLPDRLFGHLDHRRPPVGRSLAVPLVSARSVKNLPQPGRFVNRTSLWYRLSRGGRPWHPRSASNSSFSSPTSARSGRTRSCAATSTAATGSSSSSASPTRRRWSRSRRPPPQLPRS